MTVETDTQPTEEKPNATETPEQEETQQEVAPEEQEQHAEGEEAKDEEEGKKEPEAKPEPPKPSPRMSKALEEAAASERRARQDRLELKRAQEALRVESQKMQGTMAQMKAELDLALTDPFKFYEKRGISPNALGKAFMEHKEPTDAEKALAKAEAAQAEVDRLKKENAEAAEKAKQNARAQNELNFRQETTDYVTSNPERWEFINAYGAQAFVAQHVIDHYRQFGKILSVDAAADLVEKQLEEKLEGVAKTKKFSSKFKLPAAPQPPAAPAKKAKPTSLNNNVTPGQGATATPDLSEEERVKRAMEALTFD